MSDKIYTNCDKCDPKREHPFEFVTFTYRGGKPVYLCDKHLNEKEEKK